MKTIDKINSIKLLSEKELSKINRGSGPGDAAYSIGYGAVISQVMLLGGIIPAGYLTYKWAKRMLQ